MNKRQPFNKYNEVQLAVIRRHPHFAQLSGYNDAWRKAWHRNSARPIVGKKRHYDHVCLDASLAWVTPLSMFSYPHGMEKYHKRRGFRTGWFLEKDGSYFYALRARFIVRDENNE